MTKTKLTPFLWVVLVSGTVETRLPAQEDRTGEALYQKLCASCHGEDLRGGQSQSLVDAIWQFGSSDWDIKLNGPDAILRLTPLRDMNNVPD